MGDAYCQGHRRRSPCPWPWRVGSAESPSVGEVRPNTLIPIALGEPGELPGCVSCHSREDEVLNLTFDVSWIELFSHTVSETTAFSFTALRFTLLYLVTRPPRTHTHGRGNGNRNTHTGVSALDYYATVRLMCLWRRERCAAPAAPTQRPTIQYSRESLSPIPRASRSLQSTTPPPDGQKTENVR